MIPWAHSYTIFAEILAKAVVYKIDTDQDNGVVAVHWYDADKVSHKATGKTFVLACNSLETPPLLLLLLQTARHRQFVEPGRTQHARSQRFPLHVYRSI